MFLEIISLLLGACFTHVCVRVDGGICVFVLWPFRIIVVILFGWPCWDQLKSKIAGRKPLHFMKMRVSRKPKFKFKRLGPLESMDNGKMCNRTVTTWFHSLWSDSSYGFVHICWRRVVVCLQVGQPHAVVAANFWCVGWCECLPSRDALCERFVSVLCICASFAHRATYCVFLASRCVFDLADLADAVRHIQGSLVAVVLLAFGWVL